MKNFLFRFLVRNSNSIQIQIRNSNFFANFFFQNFPKRKIGFVAVFVSTVDDPSLPIFKVELNESRDLLWGKTKRAFKHLWLKYGREFDWFFKTDDDTYRIPSNNFRVEFVHTIFGNIFYFLNSKR